MISMCKKVHMYLLTQKNNKTKEMRFHCYPNFKDMKNVPHFFNSKNTKPSRKNVLYI